MLNDCILIHMNVIFNLDKMYKVMIAIISINNIYEENMKKIIALLVCFVALIPVTVFANEYNYSDNYVSIILLMMFILPLKEQTILPIMTLDQKLLLHKLKQMEKVKLNQVIKQLTQK